MTELQLTYYEDYCKCKNDHFFSGCFNKEFLERDCTCNCEDIIFGKCMNAIHVSPKYKGISTKNYEIEIIDNIDYAFGVVEYYAEVKVGKKTYKCDKVILNGEVIFDSEANKILPRG